MSGRVIHWPHEVARGWLIIETNYGEGHGELRERSRPKGALRWTETGPLWLVRDAIKEVGDGLPIFERPLIRRRSA